ncbi:MAG TPA: acetate kinase, partial [Armatimonadota bacterium]|nr:acetate kinase [Armatimonadota bacterium]
IQRVEGMDAAEVDRLLNRECGLKALSGESADMRDIEAGAAAGNPRARLAFDVFCHHVRKYVGAYAAVLGGLDAVVFTAGIGENSAGVRASVCRGLEFLGIRLDAALNGKKARGPRDVAAADAPARVLVIPTYEELVIARDTEATLRMA